MPFVRPKIDLGHLPKNRLEETVESAMQRFGYDVFETIGSGGVAIVRRAQCKFSGKVIAVKCYRCQDDEFRQFVRDEYNIMSNLRHDAVLLAEGIRESRNIVLLLLEWCTNGSLNSYVRAHGPFSEFDARGLLRQLHKGVDYMHTNRTIHCDLKPDNLLFTNEMVLKISDFNSASKIGDHSNTLLSERGDRLFSAPELRLGCIWNERVDVWACGLCAYFTLFAKLPFNITDPKVAKCFFEGVLPPMSWNRAPTREGGSSTISEVMQNYVLGCLVIPPSHRPSAMEVLLHPIFVQGASAPPAWALSPLLTPAWRLGNESLLPFASEGKQTSANSSLTAMSQEVSLSKSRREDYEEIGYACLTSAVLLTSCGLVSTRAT
jgi:serine/threonine protein kinase